MTKSPYPFITLIFLFYSLAGFGQKTVTRLKEKPVLIEKQITSTVKQKGSPHKKLKNFYKEKRKDLFKNKPRKWVDVTEGKASFSYQHAKRKGNYNWPTPESFSQFSIYGKAQIIGIPLTVQGLVQSNAGFSEGNYGTVPQQENYFSIGLDVDTWKHQSKQQLDDQIKTLDKEFDNAKFEKLEDLFNIYEAGDIEFLQDEVFNQQIENFEKVRKDFTDKSISANDSLNNELGEIQQAIEKNDTVKNINKTRKKLFNKKNEVSQKYRTEKEKAKAIQQDIKENEAIQDVGKANEWSKAEVKNFHEIQEAMDEQDMNIHDLKHAQHTYNELKEKNPELLAKFENYLLLKKLQETGDPKIVKRLHKRGLVSNTEYVLSHIKTFNIGLVSPLYGDYLLKNTPVKGAEIAVEINGINLAYTGINAQNPYLASSWQSQKLQAIQVGKGDKAESHIHFSWLHGSTYKPSTKQQDVLMPAFSDASFYMLPHKNAVIGSNFQWKINDFLAVEGQLARSATAVKSSEYSSGFFELNQQLVVNQSDSSFNQSGSALGLQLHSKIKSTQLTLRWDRISPNFYSMGVSFLQNNRISYEISARQPLWKGQIQLEPFYGISRSNLDKSQSAQAHLQNYGVRLQLYIPNLPYLMVNYQHSDVRNDKINRIELLNLNAGYTKKFDQAVLQTNLTASWQHAMSLYIDGQPAPNTDKPTGSQVSKIYNLVQMYTHQNGFEGSANFALRNFSSGLEAGDWKIIGGQVSQELFKKWTNGVAFEWGQSNEEGKTHTLSFHSSIKLFPKVITGLRVTHFSLSGGESTTISEGAFTAEIEENYEELKTNFTISYLFK